MLHILAAGGLVSFLNFGIHALMTALVVVATRHTDSRTDHLHVFARLIALLAVTMLVLMIAHVMEIAVWAAFYGLAGFPIRKPAPRSFPAAISSSRSRTTPRSATATRWPAAAGG